MCRLVQSSFTTIPISSNHRPYLLPLPSPPSIPSFAMRSNFLAAVTIAIAAASCAAKVDLGPYKMADAVVSNDCIGPDVQCNRQSESYCELRTRCTRVTDCRLSYQPTASRQARQSKCARSTQSCATQSVLLTNGKWSTAATITHS